MQTFQLYTMNRYIRPLVLVTRMNTYIPVHKKTAIEQGFHSKLDEVTVEGLLNRKAVVFQLNLMLWT